MSDTDISDRYALHTTELKVNQQGDSYTLYRTTGTTLHTLNKYDTDGNLAWSVDNIEAVAMDLFTLEQDSLGQEQIHLFDHNPLAGISWHAFDAAGNTLVDLELDAGSIPPLRNTNFHLVDSDTLLLTNTTTSLSSPPTAAGELYIVTPQSIQLAYTTQYPVLSLQPNSDALGNIYLTGYSKNISFPSDAPSFVVKLNENAEFQWQVQLPDDIAVDDFGHFTITADGNVHLIEVVDGAGVRVRTINSDGSASKAVDLSAATRARILGSDADSNLYIEKRTSQWSIPLQASVYVVTLEKLTTDGIEQTLIGPTEYIGIYLPAELDPSNGFRILSVVDKTIASFPEEVERISSRVAVDLYDLNGLFQKRILSSANIYSSAQGIATSNEQVGDSFLSVGQDASGAVYSLIGPRWQNVMDEAFPDITVDLRKY